MSPFSRGLGGCSCAVHLYWTGAYSMMICRLPLPNPAAAANMSQSSLVAPSTIHSHSHSAHGAALANEAALLYHPALSPSSQSLAVPVPAPQSESESLPLQGSSPLQVTAVVASSRCLLYPSHLRSDYRSLPYLILARSHPPLHHPPRLIYSCAV